MDIIKAERKNDGTVVHEVEKNGIKKEIHYQELRGGISWAGVCPTESAPHYFCILGAEWAPKPFNGQETQRGVLRLVSEHKAESLMAMNDFFRRLTDDAVKYCCTSFYADIQEKDGEANPYLVAIRKYLSEYQVNPGISLRQAPFVESFAFSMGEIGNLREKQLLEIGRGTLIREQLSRIQGRDLAEYPEIRFYAVNALRHVVAQFFKSPASNMGAYKPPRKIIRYRKG